MANEPVVRDIVAKRLDQPVNGLQGTHAANARPGDRLHCKAGTFVNRGERGAPCWVQMYTGPRGEENPAAFRD